MTASLFPLNFCVQINQVSRAALMAVPTQRTIELAKPRPPAMLAEEWDPIPKPKAQVSNYSRLLRLASEWTPLWMWGWVRDGLRPILARCVSFSCLTSLNRRQAV